MPKKSSRKIKEEKKETYEYNTPLRLFKFLDKYFDFKIDPCAMAGNNWLDTKVCYTQTDDGLKQEWDGAAFVNPPYGYGNEQMWLEKCYEEHSKYGQPVFILLPSKTEETDWFPRAMIKSDVVLFVQKRVNFLKNGLIKNRPIMGSIIFGMVKLNDIRFRKFRLEFINDMKIETDTKCMYFPDVKKIETVINK